MLQKEEFKEYTETWFEELSLRIQIGEMEKATLKSYKNGIRKLEGWLEEYPKSFLNLKIADAKRFARTLASKQSVSTTNLAISAIKSFYNFLVESEIISNSGFLQRGIHIQQKKNFRQASINKKSIDFDQVKEVLTHLKPERNLAAAALMAGAGLRISEVIKLSLDDISTEEEIIKIQINESKGSALRFTFFLNKELEDTFKNYIENQNAFYPFKMDESNMRHRLSTISKKLDFTVTPHSFRHFFAIHALQLGISKEELQSLLGHTSILTTEIYAKINQVDFGRKIYRIRQDHQTEGRIN